MPKLKVVENIKWAVIITIITPILMFVCLCSMINRAVRINDKKQTD